MSTLGLLSLLAAALQLSIPSYALRLVRRFGVERVGWFLVSAFACLGLLHLLDPIRGAKGMPGSALVLDGLYAIASVLLLIGMAHVEALISAKVLAANEEKKLQRKMELQIQERTLALEKRNLELAQEVACRAQREKTLQDLEAQYRFLFAQNPQPMWILDLRSSRFLAVNKSALVQCGFTEQEFMNLGAAGLVSPSRRASFQEDINSRCSGVELRGRWPLLKKDGTTLEVEITAVDLKYGDSPARLIVPADVSSHEREMHELLEAQRLNLIGKIAGGVAHHFNNILTVITGRTELLQQSASDSELRSHLENMHAAAHRGAYLTRQLLAAGGQQVIDLAPVNLHDCLQRLQPTLQRLMGERISVITNFSTTLPLAMADARAVESIVLGLALNGRDAMRWQGVLSLSTRTIRISQSEAAARNGLKAGEYICVKVSDNGCGMPPEVQARIYEPFFTTKEVGKGTGLGLASAFGLARQQSGWIEWRSEVKRGTDVELLLPCGPRGAVTSAPVTTVKAQTVLLVEPDDRARALARYILNRLGHTVIESDSATIALSLWQSEQPRIGLLLTALALPGGVTGLQLAKRLRSVRPELKVLYTCGSSDEDQKVSAGVEKERMMAKPYTAEAMLRSLEEILGQAEVNGSAK